MSSSARPLACGLSQSGEELDFFSCCYYGVTSVRQELQIPLASSFAQD